MDDQILNICTSARGKEESVAYSLNSIQRYSGRISGMWKVLGANAARIRYPDYITAIPEYQLRYRTGPGFPFVSP